MKLLEIRGGRRTLKGNGQGKHRGDTVVAHAQVDDAHHTTLVNYSWSLNSKGYPMTKIPVEGGQKTVQLHQAVWLLTGRLLPRKPNQLDHKDRNPLNSQSSNLREASRSLQAVNKGLSRNNTSGRKGVSWNKQTRKWRANIKIHGKQTYLGLFDDIDLAAQAYRQAHLEVHGIPPVE